MPIILGEQNLKQASSISTDGNSMYKPGLGSVLFLLLIYLGIPTLFFAVAMYNAIVGETYYEYRPLGVFLQGCGLGAMLALGCVRLSSVDWGRVRYRTNKDGITEYRRGRPPRTGYWVKLVKARIVAGSVAFQFEDGEEIRVWNLGTGIYRPVIDDALRRCVEAGLEHKIERKTW